MVKGGVKTLGQDLKISTTGWEGVREGKVIDSGRNMLSI